MNMIQIAILTLAAATAFPAQATDADDLDRSTVFYGELDLTKPQAVEVLYKRIRFAAELVCQRQFAKEVGAGRVLWKKCTSAAISQAVADIDAPALTQLYAAKTRKSPAPVAVAAGR